MEDKNFAERLNILRAGVLGANDGIISIAGVVIGVASATSNIWFILISALSAIFAGAFSMAGGEYVSVSTQKDTEEAAIAKEQALLDRSPEAARESLYQTFLSQGIAKQQPKSRSIKPSVKILSRSWLKKNMEWTWMKLPIHGMLPYQVSCPFQLVPCHQH